MSHEIKATTDGFNSSAATRQFVLNPLGDVSVYLETSDPQMHVCAVADSVMGALDYGAGPEAQNVMRHLIQEAEGRNHALSLTLKSADNQPKERKSTMSDTIAAPAAQKSFAPAADPAVVVDARTKSDFEISAEYGGVQYAAAVQRGQIFDCP